MRCPERQDLNDRALLPEAFCLNRIGVFRWDQTIEA